MDLLIAIVAAATTIAVPGRGAATPSIAVRGSLAVVVFSGAAEGGQTDVFAAVSRDGGVRFGAPVRVNDVAGAADVNGEQPPRVELVEADAVGARGADGAGGFSRADPAIVVVWTAKGADGTRLLQSRSTDGGRTFTPAAIVVGTDARGNRGWESIAGPFALWLDHRELARDSEAPTAHQHAGGEVMTERSKLYVGSLDGSVAPHPIAQSVCYCCKTAIAATGAGASAVVYAAWRHVFPGSVRDIAFSVSRDGGRTFAPPLRVSDDRWVLQGCPENGPALAVGPNGTAHIIWPTLTRDAGGEENLALFYARSVDGARFTPRRAMPTEGTPRHPQLAAASDGSLLATWDESTAGRRRVIVSRVTFDPTGAPVFAREALGDGVYPAVAGGDAPIVAWVARDGIRVRRVAQR